MIFERALQTARVFALCHAPTRRVLLDLLVRTSTAARDVFFSPVADGEVRSGFNSVE
jgi:hypothetical protein